MGLIFMFQRMILGAFIFRTPSLGPSWWRLRVASTDGPGASAGRSFRGHYRERGLPRAGESRFWMDWPACREIVWRGALPVRSVPSNRQSLRSWL